MWSHIWAYYESLPIPMFSIKLYRLLWDYKSWCEVVWAYYESVLIPKSFYKILQAFMRLLKLLWTHMNLLRILLIPMSCYKILQAFVRRCELLQGYPKLYELLFVYTKVLQSSMSLLNLYDLNQTSPTNVYKILRSFYKVLQLSIKF